MWAIHRLNAAEQRFNTLIKMAKMMEQQEGRWSANEGMGTSQQGTAQHIETSHNKDAMPIPNTEIKKIAIIHKVPTAWDTVKGWPGGE